MLLGLHDAPWVVRVTQLHMNAARDEDAEGKVTKMTEEIKDLAKEIRSKVRLYDFVDEIRSHLEFAQSVQDQNIQEYSVKIELMEKRAESVKKQADTMVELESELSKYRKQEKDYQVVVEQLQGDLDVMERDNAKLKQNVTPEKQSKNDTLRTPIQAD